MSLQNPNLPNRRPLLFWVGLVTIFLGAAATTPLGPPATGAKTCISCGVLGQDCQAREFIVTEASLEKSAAATRLY